MRRIITGLGATILIAVLLVGMPVLLIAASAIGLPHIELSPAGIWQALLTPDDGTLALTLIKAAGWITWAIFAAMVLVEAIAAIRRVKAPQLRGLSLPQGLARSLVATAIALFINTQTALAPATDTIAQPAAAAAPATEPHHAPAAKAGFDRYTVKKGDILSQLALDHLGDAHRYPEIYQASKTIEQPGGHKLTDPDVIDIGWKLNIPTDQSEAEPKPVKKPAEPAKQSPTSTPPAGSQAADPAASAQPSAGEDPDDQLAAAAPQTASDDDLIDAQPAWLLPGLAGAGAILAGALWIALRRRWDAQHRHRRPGRMTAPTPLRLRAVEKTLRHQGQPIADLLGFVDETLRRLAANITNGGQPLPALIAVEVGRSSLTLHLAGDTELAPPWQPEPGQIWTITTEDDPDDLGPLAPNGPAPWPHLVTIGADDNHHWWLLNLEQAGTATITGNPDYSDDLARYLAAELATTPWSRDIELDLVGVFEELAGLNPARIHYHPTAVGIDDAIAAAVGIIDRINLTQATDAATARATQAGDDLWPSHVLITRTQPDSNLGRLADLLHTTPGRTATAALIIGTGTPDQRGIEIHAGTDGRVRIPQLGLDLIVNGITLEEARGSIALLQAADNVEDAPVPAGPTNAEPWSGLCDEAGNLNKQLTTPRDPNGSDASVLPEPDEVILATAATTAEDLAELAPNLPAETVQRVADADPTLDADLADWFADHCDRPRLAVLGKMRVKGGHETKVAEANRRKPFYTEIVAYLATRPNGATMNEICAAFDPFDADTMRRRLAVVRTWLGINPTTREPYLPLAAQSPARASRGVSTYQVTNLIVDADLFRRLRLRGQTRGPAGLSDFTTALSLVTGTPYAGFRDGGGIWLTDKREDQTLLVAIVDLAHLVATMAIQNRDYDTARRVVSIAMKAAPHEEMPKLDLIAIADAEGSSDESREVARQIYDQQDDEGPIELDERTRQMLAGSSQSRV